MGLAAASYLMHMENAVGLQGFQYGFLIVLACFGYAVSTNLIKKNLFDIPSIAINAISFVLVGWLAIIILFSFTDFTYILLKNDYGMASLGYISTLAISSTALASVVYFKLIKETNALFASSVSYLTPVVAISWGLFNSEILSVYHFAGMGLILTGIYLSKD